MTNETFEPVGLLDIAKQIKTSREKLDDLTERMQSALDHKRDVSSAMSDELQEVMKRNQAMWQSGYDEGFKAGSLSSTEPTSEERDRDLLESHGIDVDGFCDQMVKLVKDHEQDIDEDEPDQYPDNYGGTK